MSEPIKPRYTKEDREWAIGLGNDLASNLNTEALKSKEYLDVELSSEEERSEQGDTEKQSWLMKSREYLFGDQATSLGQGLGIFLSFLAVTVGGYIFLFIFLIVMGLVASFFGINIDSQDTPDCLYEYGPYGGGAC